MEPPGPNLRAELERAGFAVSLERATAAFAAEIDFYLSHHTEGGDPDSLERLRDRCAAVLAQALGEPGLDHATARRSMLAAIRFHAYPDAAPALEELRGRGLRLAVASNWDSSLPEVLARTGLAGLVDGAVSSAEAGAPKPDPTVFRAALELVGCAPEQALHVGDSQLADVEGARAAGLEAILLRRAGPPSPEASVSEIAALTELASLTLAIDAR
ncbi:MAG: hypothetical protein NVSMB25_00240 [Thermoleophilaceae bacterium]